MVGAGEGGHRVELRLTAEGDNDIYTMVSASISSDKARILEISSHITPMGTIEFQIAIEVNSLEHLEQVLQHLRQTEQVIMARRA